MISQNQNLMNNLKNIQVNERNKKWLIGLSITAVVLIGVSYFAHVETKKHKVNASNLADKNNQLQLSNTTHKEIIAQQQDVITQLQNEKANLMQQVINTSSNASTPTV